MKPENKNGKVAKSTTNRKEYKFFTNSKIKEPYWDEGWTYYPKYRRGFKKSKQILKYQVRMYRTWKHNRRTRWKKTK